MMKMNAYRKALITALALASLGAFWGACVTVNVNFPESAVQNATDDYVRELYRAKGKGPSPTPAEATPVKKSTGQSEWENLKRYLYPESIAFAADTESFNAKTPKALKIRDRQIQRMDEIMAYKSAGVLGENNLGLLELRNKQNIKAPVNLEKVQKAITDENKDREDLYDEVLSANHMASNKLKSIQASFARSFQSISPTGTWIQDADGNWTQKK